MNMETETQAPFPVVEPSAETPKSLSLDTPVPPEVLERLRDMELTRSRIGHQLIDLENERISLIAGARRIDDERNKLFHVLLVERGLAPNTPVSIDPETGLMSQIKPPGV